MNNKIENWDRLSEDFNGIAGDEELLITLGGRMYIVRAASTEDIENHFKDGETKCQTELK
jgi:hypothetical protein